MSNDAFRDELRDNCKKDISLITRNIKGITDSMVVESLIKATLHTKGADSHTDTLIYKVAVVIDLLRKDNFKGTPNRRNLINTIASYTGLDLLQVKNTLYRYNWNLPSYLVVNHYKTREPRRETTVTVEEPKLPETRLTELIDKKATSATIKVGDVTITITFNAGGS